MRVIGHFENDKDARTFGDFLYVQGIQNEAERDGNRWAIWVHSDDQLDAARKLLEEFRASPNDPRFLAGSPAEKLREQAAAEDAAYRKRMIEGRRALPGLTHYGFGPITYTLIIVSVVVFVLMRFGEQPARAAALYISECVGEACPPFSELRAGQAWRLFTPMFLHFGILHILGNMLWLKDLGSMFEARMRSWYFAVFVLTVAAMSNMAQYLATSSPAFGGMSGVVFGLIGYCYVRGRFDPGSGIHLDRNSMIFALIWFALCFTGMVGRIANVAHTAGLVLGAVWAFVDSKRRG